MRRTLIRDLAVRPAGTMRLCGWVHATAGHLDRASIVLRDHTGTVRVVHDRAFGSPGLGDDLRGLRRESAVEVIGHLTPTAGGDVELALEELRVAGPAAAEPPVLDGAGLEERLDWRFLDLRTPRNQLIFHVQTSAERAMRAYWHERGFVELHSPKLRPTPNKSGAELFRVEHFGRPAYLAQSPQFYKQMAMAAGFDRIFEIGPVFRANPSVTPRHDTEFTSIDVEMSWIDSHDDLMAFEEGLLRHVLGAVRQEHGDRITDAFGVTLDVPASPFPRVTLSHARKIVASSGGTIDEEADDLDADSQRRLSEHVAREHGHEFVFVTDYPEPSRPFYHMRCDEGSAETRSFDLLWKGVEITTGAQREHRYGRLAAQASARGIALESIGQYLDFFRFGCPPHGGFGLGLTRLLMGLVGLENVREVTYLYRGPDRMTP